ALTPSGSTPHAAKSPACRVTERSRKGRFALFAGSLKYLSLELLQGASVVSACSFDSDATVRPFSLSRPCVRSTSNSTFVKRLKFFPRKARERVFQFFSL